MKKLTRQQAIIISGYTGFLACDINELKRDASERLGFSVMTHHLSERPETLRIAYKDDFVAIANMSIQGEYGGDPYEENRLILENTQFDLEEIEKIRSSGFKFKIEITRESGEPPYVNVDVGYEVDVFVGEKQFVSIPKNSIKALLS